MDAAENADGQTFARVRLQTRDGADKFVLQTASYFKSLLINFDSCSLLILISGLIIKHSD